jgi:hypothetical protein
MEKFLNFKESIDYLKFFLLFTLILKNLLLHFKAAFQVSNLSDLLELD